MTGIWVGTWICTAYSVAMGSPAGAAGLPGSPARPRRAVTRIGRASAMLRRPTTARIMATVPVDGHVFARARHASCAAVSSKTRRTALEHVTRQRFREEPAGDDARDPGQPQGDRRPPAHVSVPLLPPRPHDDRGDDREERRALSAVLLDPEHDGQRRHEQDPSPDAEEADQHPGQRRARGARCPRTWLLDPGDRTERCGGGRCRRRGCDRRRGREPYGRASRGRLRTGRRRGRDDHEDRTADASARPERHDRGTARRRGGQGLLRRRRRVKDLARRPPTPPSRSIARSRGSAWRSRPRRPPSIGSHR